MINHTKKHKDETEEELVLIGNLNSGQNYGATTQTTIDNGSLFSMHACWRGFVWLINGIIALGAWLLKPLAFAALFREVFFSMLMYFALYQNFIDDINIFAPNRQMTPRGVIKATAGTLAVVNLANDLISVEVSGSVDKFLNEPRERNPYRFTAMMLVQSTAWILSYPAGSLTDVLGLKPFIDAMMARYIVMGVIILLGQIYYSMMTTKNIQNHVNAFIKACIKLPKRWEWMKSNKLGLMHATLMSLGNIIYRAILFGSLFSLTLSEYLEIETQAPWQNIVKIMVMAATAIVTIFSRTLPVIHRWAPIKNSMQSKDVYTLIEEFNKEKSLGFCIRTVIAASGFPMLRAVGLGLTAYWGLNLLALPPVVPETLSTLIGAGTFTLSYYAQLHGEFYGLCYPRQLKSRTENSMTRQQMANAAFERKVATCELPVFAHFMINTINYTTRFARVVAFPLFMSELFASFGVSLPVEAVIGVTLFAAGEVAHNELYFYLERMLYVLSTYATKWKLAKDIIRVEAIDADTDMTSIQASEADKALNVTQRIYRGMSQFRLVFWCNSRELIERQTQREEARSLVINMV